MRATDTVLFDFDDTLLDPSAASEAAVFNVATLVSERFGIAALELATTYLQECRASDAVVPRARHWGRALAYFGIRDRELAGFCAFVTEQMLAKERVVLPGVPELLTGLRRRGMKVGLLANRYDRMQRRQLERLGLDDAFDEIVISEEIGSVESDPEIFRYACKRLSTSVETSAMVGDLYDRDIVAAHKAGLFTIWVNRGQATLPPMATKPDAMVTSIDDIPHVLPPIFRR